MGDPAGHRVWPPAGSKRDEDGRTVRFERETGGGARLRAVFVAGGLLREKGVRMAKRMGVGPFERLMVGERRRAQASARRLLLGAR